MCSMERSFSLRQKVNAVDKMESAKCAKFARATIYVICWIVWIELKESECSFLSSFLPRKEFLILMIVSGIIFASRLNSIRTGHCIIPVCLQHCNSKIGESIKFKFSNDFKENVPTVFDRCREICLARVGSQTIQRSKRRHQCDVKNVNLKLRVRPIWIKP